MAEEDEHRAGDGRGATVEVEELTSPTPADADALARLLPQLSSSTPPDVADLARITSAPGTTLLVARSGGEIVGSLTLVVVSIPTGVRALVEDVVVDEGERGRGIGRSLVEHAIAVARGSGARTVDLTSRPSRAAANRLYESTGFVRRETNVWRFDLE
ncbi:MAG: GNAT family N-acetyltransferase [Actinomycetota bacterium]|nr:GNAT family N-acetyltransferase [Actinomycetota bacterium]